VIKGPVESKLSRGSRRVPRVLNGLLAARWKASSLG